VAPRKVLRCAKVNRTPQRPDGREISKDHDVDKKQERLIVSVATRQELDAALDRAVDILRPAATAEGVGILVTRLAAGRFEATLDRRVLRGTTKERWTPLTDPR
jgi:hypothetical protein